MNQQAAVTAAAPYRLLPRLPWFTLVAVACFAVAAAPLLAWYWQRLTDGSDEPLGVLALLAAIGLMAVNYWKHADRTKLSVHPRVMLAGALLLALIQASPLAHFPLLSGFIAVAVLGFSVSMSAEKPGIVALLVLSLPLVASLDFYMGYPLRVAATHLAVFLLNVFRIGVERAGVLMLDGDNVVGMDPPCAGVRMLWTACFTAALIGAQRRFDGIRLLLLLAGAIVCVVLGNSVRAALVFFPESGRVHWPHWMHPGVGLLVHGAVLALVFSLGGWLSQKRRWVSGVKLATGFTMRRCRTPMLRALAVVGMVVLGSAALCLTRDDGKPSANREEIASWPATLDGRPLIPVPLSSREASFAKLFPGRLAKFRCGEEEVIFRRVAAATRFMHPAGDCLRAAGFTVTSKPVQKDADGRVWGCSLAERAGDAWRVRERYVNDGQNRVCTDASAWFWQALLHPDEGPWTAITIMEKMPAVKLVAAE